MTVRGPREATEARESRGAQSLPPGVELLDGTFLTFGPRRNCPCSDCAASFVALACGELGVPTGSLPW